MPSIKADLFKGVPVIGQPQIHVWAGPQVSFQCGCEAKTQMMVAGFNFQAVCPACKRVHMLKSFGYDMLAPMEGTLELTTIMPQVNDGKS